MYAAIHNKALKDLHFAYIGGACDSVNTVPAWSSNAMLDTADFLSKLALGLQTWMASCTLFSSGAAEKQMQSSLSHLHCMFTYVYACSPVQPELENTICRLLDVLLQGNQAPFTMVFKGLLRLVQGRPHRRLGLTVTLIHLANMEARRLQSCPCS